MVGHAGCRRQAVSSAALLAAATAVTSAATTGMAAGTAAAMAAALLAGCEESAAERFAVQADGDRFFVRERRGWFSAMLPCKPELTKVEMGTDKIRMQVASCMVDGETYTITFGRFKIPAGAQLSMDQIYERAARGMDGVSARVVPGGRLKMEEVTVAGRPARYLSYQNIDGKSSSAHVWILWAEEQQSIYQIMQIGSRVPTEGLRIARSMLVPSP